MTESDLTRLLVEQAGSAGPWLLIGWWVARRLSELCQRLGDATRALTRGPHELRVVHVLASDDRQVLDQVRELLTQVGTDRPSPSVRDPPAA